MPPKNKRSAARHDPDQQPSLLEALEPDEGPEWQYHKQQDHEQHEIENESPAESSGTGNGDLNASREDAQREHEDRESVERENDDHSVAKDQPSQSTAQTPEPLKRAYERYVEIINDTYDSKFSDAKRGAAFKEAARAHGVKITDLKRYSTAAALGIPYHSGAESEPCTDDTLPASQTD